MAVASAPRHAADWWRSPWLFAVLGALLLVAGTFGVGIATGFLRGGGPSGAAPARSPLASPSAPATPSPSPAMSPTPLASPTPASVLAGVRGKLAVSNGTSGSGGWITFPGGAFTTDSGSSVTLPNSTWAAGLTHDLRLNRWLPVPRDWVTPDGTRYVYSDYTGLHLVTPGQGQVDLASFGQYSYATILTATDTGAYVVPSAYAGAGLLWVPFTGTPKVVTTGGYWTLVRGQYAYGSRSQSLPQGAANTVVRLDLSTGATKNVFTQSGMTSTPVGVDTDGNLVVLAQEATAQPELAQIWLVQAAGPIKIYEADIGPQPSLGMRPAYLSVFSVVADPMGTWIATSKGLYLYSRSAGMEPASQVTGPLASALRS